jgi:hypothetical protein
VLPAAGEREGAVLFAAAPSPLVAPPGDDCPWDD